jgi:hypothetical protein
MKNILDDFDGPFELKREPLWFHKRNLMQTATGFGEQLKTEWMIKIENRWHRIFCRIYSNIGLLFIKKANAKYVLSDITFEELLDNVNEENLS